MRHNPKHAVDDPAIVRRLVAENPWGTLVSHAGGLVASHYPILLDEDYASPALADDMERALRAGG